MRIRKPYVALPGTLDYFGVEITRGRADEHDEYLEDDDEARAA